MNYRIVVHYAELALKGGNRKLFVKRLRQNINKKLVSLGKDWKVSVIHDRLFVTEIGGNLSEAEKVVHEVARIPGIAWLSLVHWFDEKKYQFLQSKPDLQPIHDIIEVLANKTYQEGDSFALKVKRSDKRFVVTSRQLSHDLADTVFQNSPWQHVNLKHADQFFYVNISSKGIAVHANKIKATGGLPVSSTGRVLTLLSGGFDSPVASWLMANRGCSVSFIHFSASHQTAKDMESYKVSKIVKKISESTGRARLFIVPYTHFDLVLMEQNLDYDLILFRRFMARVAEQVMHDIHAQAIVTGDNLGQVASQTMKNMNSMDQSITTPLLRPLLTYNKEQIIELSTQLGLFDLCCEPYKDCCALISKSPKTKSKAVVLQKMEEKYLGDYQQLIQDTLAEMTEVVYNFGQLEAVK